MERWSFLPVGLEHPQVRALAARHLADMAAWSPPGTCHAFSPDRLAGPDLWLGSLWDAEALVGLGGLLTLGPEDGELKAMRVADPYLGRGAGQALLGHLLARARALGLRRVWLETGSSPPFLPALRLYARAGFVRCPPFGGYRENGFAVFFRLNLDAEP